MMSTKSNQGIKYEIHIELPVKQFSETSHLKNIEYCIKKIEEHSKNCNIPVIGYHILRALGTRHIDHKIIPKNTAEELKKDNQQFDYITLDDLLKVKKEIDKGKYKLHNGLIIGYNKPPKV